MKAPGGKSHLAHPATTPPGTSTFHLPPGRQLLQMRLRWPCSEQRKVNSFHCCRQVGCVSGGPGGLVSRWVPGGPSARLGARWALRQVGASCAPGGLCARSPGGLSARWRQVGSAPGGRQVGFSPGGWQVAFSDPAWQVGYEAARPRGGWVWRAPTRGGGCGKGV